MAFHGQFYADGGRFRRVDGNDRYIRNVRAPILNCNTDDPNTPDTFFFYPGEYTNGEAASFDQHARIMVEFTNYLVQQGLLTVATFTGPSQGQLQLSPPDDCGRQYFVWNGYTRSRQFGPNGAPPPGGPPPSTGDDNEQDDDGI